MFALAGLAVAQNPLVFQAASTVAKKAFEAVAARSLKGISEVVSERYKGDAEVMRLRDELELKVRILALPVDICVQQAVRGNSALQGVLDVALVVLRDIEDFEDSLRNQDVALGRGTGSTPSRESHAQVAKRLSTLIQQLDSQLPYLSVAISAVNLLESGDQQVSPSRLMAASFHIRAASTQPGSEILALTPVTWHHEGRPASGSKVRPMQNQFPLCSVTVRRGPAAEDESTAESGAHNGDLRSDFVYELVVQQSLDDGIYHEDDEEPGSLTLRIDDILAIDWATSQSLKLGDNDFTPALILHVDHSGSTARQPKWSLSNSVVSTSMATPQSTASTAQASYSRLSNRPSPTGQLTPQTPVLTARFAIQCRAPPPPDSDEEGSTTDRVGSSSKPEKSSAASGAVEGGSPDAKGAGKAPGAKQDAITADWVRLGELEYVLRLCMLEAREEMPHHLVKDERIHMALAGSLDFGVLPKGVATPMSRRMPSPEVDSLARDFGRVGFGSPVG